MDHSADQSQMCSNVVFGLALFLLSGFLPGLLCEVCTNEAAIIAAQQTCKHSNEAIIDAKDEDTTAVCSNFFLFLKCVAANSSQCFDQVFNMMHSYFDSPYHCEQTQDQILELQRLKDNAITTPTTKETTEPSSQPTKVSYTDIDTTESKEIQTTSRAKHGSKGEHTGSHNSSSTVMSAGLFSLVLMLISSMLSFVLTRD